MLVPRSATLVVALVLGASAGCLVPGAGQDPGYESKPPPPRRVYEHPSAVAIPGGFRLAVNTRVGSDDREVLLFDLDGATSEVSPPEGRPVEAFSEAQLVGDGERTLLVTRDSREALLHVVTDTSATLAGRVDATGFVGLVTAFDGVAAVLAWENEDHELMTRRVTLDGTPVDEVAVPLATRLAIAGPALNIAGRDGQALVTWWEQTASSASSLRATRIADGVPLDPQGLLQGEVAWASGIVVVRDGYWVAHDRAGDAVLSRIASGDASVTETVLAPPWPTATVMGGVEVGDRVLLLWKDHEQMWFAWYDETGAPRGRPLQSAEPAGGVQLTASGDQVLVVFYDGEQLRVMRMDGAAPALSDADAVTIVENHEEPAGCSAAGGASGASLILVLVAALHVRRRRYASR